MGDDSGRLEVSFAPATLLQLSAASAHDSTLTPQSSSLPLSLLLLSLE